jgi:hypothetical protein
MTTTATFADDTAILASDSDPAIASLNLQTYLNSIQTSRMQTNPLKSVHITFTTRSGKCPPVHMNNIQIPSADHVKYLGLHLDSKLTWRHHIFTRRKQLGLTLTKMNWLLGRRSHLSLPNKLLLYKSILKPILTYGIQLWGTASLSNIEILECFQSTALGLIAYAPWYVPNIYIRYDLQLPSIKEEISRSSLRYYKRLTTHPNDQVLALMAIPGTRRLRKTAPNDLPDRFPF